MKGESASTDVFMRLAQRPGVFFLDSALPHERFGRYSLIGCEPSLTISADQGEITITRNGVSRTFQDDPFEALRAAIAECGKSARIGLCPEIPFTGGLVGYLGYDLRHFVERLPRNSRRDQRFPDMHFGFYDAVLCHDNARGEWLLCGEGTAADSLRRAVEQAVPARVAPERILLHGRIESNFKKEQYLKAVKSVIDYIRAGDIFQANLSQRFECEVDCSPTDVYARLREANAAPFAAYLDIGGGRCVMSSSPERFLKVDGRRVETRPIKGTRPRLNDAAADEIMRRELLASEKDNAELAMIVDLERNDLGRVCEFGTVRVDEARALETYATVHHLVATVSGTMRAGCGIVDLLRATFPGGSITGAPKIRAMEIIDELEPTARSVYTGAIGFIGLDGRADLNIAIRTLLMDGPRVTFQAGGGIVADSDPEAEYEETLAKGRGIMQALGAEI
jgi:para-aminobenzoate synthetase component 1